MRALARLCVGLTVAGAFSLAVTAHAEGLVYGDPLNPPYYNWNGLYIGADMGSRVFTTDRTLITSTAGFESGWTVGAGWERMLTPALSVKVEYLHYDLGTDRVAGFCCGGALTRFFDIENSGDLVRVGLNYRFGERLAPVPPPPTK